MTRSKASVGAPAVGCRIGQRADDLGELDERSRPAVRDEQRERVRMLRLLMDEVNFQSVDGGREVVELVQLPFLCPPVELVAPVRHQVLEIGDVSAVGPAILKRRRKPRTGEPRLEVGEHRVGNPDRERHDPFVRSLTGDQLGRNDMRDQSRRPILRG